MSHFNEHSLEMAIMELFEQQGEQDEGRRNVRICKKLKYSDSQWQDKKVSHSPFISDYLLLNIGKEIRWFQK